MADKGNGKTNWVAILMLLITFIGAGSGFVAWKEEIKPFFNRFYNSEPDPVVQRIYNSLKGESDEYRYDGRQGSPCSGNTYKARVNITNVEATISDNIVNVVVSYQGDYVRRKFSFPCRHSATEKKELWGNYSFEIDLNNHSIIPKFKNLTNFGEASGEGHDSNKYAKNALNELIAKYLKIQR